MTCGWPRWACTVVERSPNANARGMQRLEILPSEHGRAEHQQGKQRQDLHDSGSRTVG